MEKQKIETEDEGLTLRSIPFLDFYFFFLLSLFLQLDMWIMRENKDENNKERDREYEWNHTSDPRPVFWSIVDRQDLKLIHRPALRI